MTATPRTANQFIEHQLDSRVYDLEQITQADVLAFTGGLLGGVDDIFRSVVEEQRERQTGKVKLAVVLTTGGGYIEVVHRIVDTLRNDLNMKIDDFSKISQLRDRIKAYYDLLDDYRVKRGDKGVIHAHGSYVPFM